jgi:hypothetical protein
MHTWGSVAPLVMTCLLALAGCTTRSDSGTRIEGAACEEACDASMGACSRNCNNDVDDNLCAQECLDKLEKCKSKCE